LQLAWSGFVDAASGIKAYELCVAEAGADVCTKEDSTWMSVGRVSMGFVPVVLSAGRTYQAFVRAVNEAGLISNFAFVNVMCDDTPPVLQHDVNISTSFVPESVGGHGVLSVSVDWSATDPESAIEASYLMLGTTAKGKQLLLPVPIVSSPVEHLVALAACPKKVFNATLSIKNAVGLTSQFETEASVSC
jgi:hypothetical protein